MWIGLRQPWPCLHKDRVTASVPYLRKVTSLYSPISRPAPKVTIWPLIRYINTIFFQLLASTCYMQRDIALPCSDLLRWSLFLHCITLYFRTKVISLEVTINYRPLWIRRLLKNKITNKNKRFSIIIIKLSSNIYLYFNTSIHHSLQLFYLTLTLHGYCHILVCSLITGYCPIPAFAAIVDSLQ